MLSPILRPRSRSRNDSSRRRHVTSGLSVIDRRGRTPAGAVWLHVISPEVLSELADPQAPPEVTNWLQSPPAWLEVRQIPVTHDDPALSQIDPGERAAILIAQQERDVLLLIDDAAGRAEANRRGIPNTGTLGILRAASIRQLLDLPNALQRLSETNFRVKRSLFAELVAEDA